MQAFPLSSSLSSLSLHFFPVPRRCGRPSSLPSSPNSIGSEDPAGDQQQLSGSEIDTTTPLSLSVSTLLLLCFFPPRQLGFSGSLNNLSEDMARVTVAMSVLVLLIAALIIFVRSLSASWDNHRYKKGDHIPLFANTVYPQNDERLRLLNSAVSLTCNHVLCNLCIEKYIKSASNCPVYKVPYRCRVSHGLQIGTIYMLDEWEENLAIITANRTKDDELVVIHLRDCLWEERGEITVAHICYLVAEANCESYSDSARICLIGVDHLKFPRTYASPEANQLGVQSHGGQCQT